MCTNVQRTTGSHASDKPVSNIMLAETNRSLERGEWVWCDTYGMVGRQSESGACEHCHMHDHDRATEPPLPRVISNLATPQDQWVRVTYPDATLEYRS